MASEKIRARLVRLHNANKRKRVRWAITGVLVVVVAVATTLAMTRPMIAQKKVAHCGKLEHVHTKDCLS
ncbi:MAG: hypothetical protein UHS51_03470, partial [Atopobiaceae bacterium]|nr:hypothetical protein [Atopobiaceae bacterium]